jgi:hypothetical protein
VPPPIADKYPDNNTLAVNADEKLLVNERRTVDNTDDDDDDNDAVAALGNEQLIHELDAVAALNNEQLIRELDASSRELGNIINDIKQDVKLLLADTTEIKQDVKSLAVDIKQYIESVRNDSSDIATIIHTETLQQANDYVARVAAAGETISKTATIVEKNTLADLFVSFLVIAFMLFSFAYISDSFKQ